MGLSGTVSEIDGNFSQKIEKKFFPPHCILHPSWRGSPWYRHWGSEN